MPFSIQFDYRLDTQGFFTAEVRAALEAAADIWEDLIEDDFPVLQAGQPFTVANLETGEREPVTLTEDLEGILVFAHTSTNLSGSLAQAGATGFDITGDINRLRFTSEFREEGATTDFEPFAGTFAVDPTFDYSFALDGPEDGKFDMISIAIHELGHILGIGGSATFQAFVEGETFTGPNAMAVTGGAGIPLEEDLAHINDGLATGPHALEKDTAPGTRDLPGDFEKAILADIGYEIEGFDKQGTSFELATEEGERIIGTALGETIDGLGGEDRISGRLGDDTILGGLGDDALFGNEGDDYLVGGAGGDSLSGATGNDTLIGGDGDDTLSGREDDDAILVGAGINVVFGNDGVDSFYFMVGDGRGRLNDFDFVNEKLYIDPFFGLTTAAQVLDLVTQPSSNVVEVVLPGGASAFVFTNDTGDTLTEANIEIGRLGDGGEDVGLLTVGDTSSEDIAGTAANDSLAGGDGNDVIRGNGGRDVLRGDAGDNVLMAGSSFTDGTAGATALYFDNADAYTVLGGSTYAVVTGPGGTRDKLFGVDTIIFDDATLALEDGSALDGAGAPEDFLIAERVALLYEAALNRDGNIDLPGLNFYISVTERDNLTDEFLAADLMNSPEFTASFGDVDTLSNSAFLEQIYLNVLDRASDAAGRQFYLDLLDDGTITRALALADIAVSPENARESEEVLMGLYQSDPGDWAFL